MDISELLKYQLDNITLQVTKVFEGIGDSAKDARSAAGAMSPRETLAHLAECYHASLLAFEGKEHEWGTYQIETADWDALSLKVFELRSRVVGHILANPNEKTAKAATDYVILHDAYHVGQMATLRIETDTEWNPYCLYG